MNCTQIQKLLPLYAGHDLGERREQSVTAHLQSCAACSLAAADFRDARALMHDFAPPVFGDEVYAEIRKNVRARIEGQPRTPSLFDSIAVWFQPRFAWTAAAALLITISVGGVYFIIKGFNVRPAIVVNVPKRVAPPVEPVPETRGDVPLNPGEGPPKRRQANIPKRQRQSDRMTAPDRDNSLVAYSSDAQSATIQSSSPIIGTDNLDSGTRGADKTLRLEIQTRNPNIRIIWFAPKEPKPLAVHAKGI
jgi:anti-sigma factor RsiW